MQIFASIKSYSPIFDFYANFGGYLMTKMVHFDPDAGIFIKSDLPKSCSPDSQENFHILGLVC